MSGPFGIFQGDFVSIELRQGMVRFQYSTGHAERHTLETRNKYNTNEWVSVSATWSRTDGKTQDLSLFILRNHI